MVKMWHERWLKPPPVCSVKLELADDTGNTNALLRKMRNFLEQTSEHLDGINAFFCELYLLQKYNRKNNNSFKSEKFFHSSTQLQRCMVRYSEVEPLSYLKPLLSMWPSTLNIHYGAQVYLPSRQMLQHVLVRLIGAALLCHESINRSVIAHAAAMEQIKIGMHLSSMIVLTAALSRIWAVCRSMKKQIIYMYDELLPLVNVLKPTQVEWLRNDSPLPENLRAFIGKELGHYPSETTFDDGIESGTSLIHQTDSEEPVSDANMKEETSYGEDVGEVVQRDSLKNIPEEDGNPARIEITSEMSDGEEQYISDTGSPAHSNDTGSPAHSNDTGSPVLTPSTSLVPLFKYHKPDICPRLFWAKLLRIGHTNPSLSIVVKLFRKIYRLNDPELDRQIKTLDSLPSTSNVQKKTVRAMLGKIIQKKAAIGRLILCESLEKSERKAWLRHYQLIWPKNDEATRNLLEIASSIVNSEDSTSKNVEKGKLGVWKGSREGRMRDLLSDPEFIKAALKQIKKKGENVRCIKYEEIDWSMPVCIAKRMKRILKKGDQLEDWKKQGKVPPEIVEELMKLIRKKGSTMKRSLKRYEKKMDRKTIETFKRNYLK